MRLTITVYTNDNTIIDIHTMECANKSFEEFIKAMVPSENLVSLSENRAIVDLGLVKKEIKGA